MTGWNLPPGVNESDLPGAHDPVDDSEISQADVDRLVRIKRLLNELEAEYTALAGEITDEFRCIYELDRTARASHRALGWEDLLALMQKDVQGALES